MRDFNMKMNQISWFPRMNIALYSSFHHTEKDNISSRRRAQWREYVKQEGMTQVVKEKTDGI